MNDTQTPDVVEQRLRTTLHAVAETVTEDAFAVKPRPRGTRKTRRRWRIAIGVGAVAIPLTLAASAVLREGPEYVDTIAPERIIMTGSVDGSRYLLMESDRTRCGKPVTGVELVEEKENLLGSEWNTTLYEYGEHIEKPCGYVIDASRYLNNPALYDSSGTEVGDSFVWVFVVHPDVDTVRITSGDYAKDLKVFEVDGAGFAPFEIPKDMNEYTSELLIDEQVVPGSRVDRKLGQP